MNKKIRLTEKDLTRIIKRVLSEDDSLAGDNIESCIRKKMAQNNLPQLNLKSEELRQIMIACRPGSNDGDMMVGCFNKGIEIGAKYGANEAQNIMKVAPMIPKFMAECSKKSNLPNT